MPAHSLQEIGAVEERTIDHLIATFVVDAQGRIAERFIGLEHEPDQVLAALAAVASG